MCVCIDLELKLLKIICNHLKKKSTNFKYPKCYFESKITHVFNCSGVSTALFSLRNVSVLQVNNMVKRN